MEILKKWKLKQQMRRALLKRNNLKPTTLQQQKSETGNLETKKCNKQQVGNVKSRKQESAKRIRNIF